MAMEQVMEEAGEKINPMGRLRLGKVTLHICVGNNWERLQKAAKLLEDLTGQKPVFKKAKKTIRAFGISRKDIISCMVTLRRDRAEEFLRRAFKAVEGIRSSSIDERGNFAFGIKEHLDLPGIKYDPEIGIFGMDVIVALEKPGRRVERRRYRKAKCGEGSTITRDEVIQYLKEAFGVEVRGQDV
jgi:large subunit ribosomal protein L5